MKKISESLVIEKKSKFIGILYEVNNTLEVEDIINNLKKEHKKAKHIVYSYKIGNLEKKYEDKEPSGSTLPILNIINQNNLNNTLIVVIRYFGGILLGKGLLTRTYSKCARELIVSNNK